MPTPVLGGRGEGNARRAGRFLEERVRFLEENAGAVAGVGFAPAGAAMVQIQEHLEGLLDDGVGLPAFDVDDKSHAAGIVLEPRVVQALFPRQPRQGVATASGT